MCWKLCSEMFSDLPYQQLFHLRLSEPGSPQPAQPSSFLPQIVIFRNVRCLADSRPFVPVPGTAVLSDDPSSNVVL